MAIDVFKRQGKSAVTGLLGKNLRRIAGNVGSVLRGDIGSNSSETAPLNRSKQSTKMLSFPLDVGADPGIGNHGHYIMFFINEQKHAVRIEQSNKKNDYLDKVTVLKLAHSDKVNKHNLKKKDYEIYVSKLHNIEQRAKSLEEDLRKDNSVLFTQLKDDTTKTKKQFGELITKLPEVVNQTEKKEFGFADTSEQGKDK